MSKSYYILVASAVLLSVSIHSICRAGIINVSVSVAPQKFFVERIGGDYVNVQVMLPEDASPATYEPSPRQLANLENSKIYIKVGHPNFIFEDKLFKRIKQGNTCMKVVNMSDGLHYIEMKAQHHHEHESHHEGRDTSDPHVWVAPYTVKIAAGTICAALCEMESAHSAEFIKNKNTFIKEIDILDKEIQDILKGVTQRKFMVYHPAWGYFAAQYGLIQIAIETGGKEPSPLELTELIKKAQEENIKVIFVQEGFPKDRASIIAKEIKGSVVEINPLEYNWIENIRKISKIFKSALTQ
ncbi:MAG: metal ABC transporter solute-binding protein, Zn/Mn family [bacterium]